MLKQGNTSSLKGKTKNPYNFSFQATKICPWETQINKNKMQIMQSGNSIPI